MRCYRRRLNITYKDHVTNEEVRNKVQDANGNHYDLLSIVKHGKLIWYGHISRASSMTKTILQGSERIKKETAKEMGRQQNKTDWAGLEFVESVREVERRVEWRGVVETSSVVPQGPSMLKD